MLTYKAARALRGEPILLVPDAAALAALPAGLTAVRDRRGNTFPAARRGENVLAVLDADEGETLELTGVGGGPAPQFAVSFAKGDNCVGIDCGGKPFTRLVTDPAFAKPFLGPVWSSQGTSFTRLDLTAKEHPHQRSVFCAVGDVSLAGGAQNVDFWNEPEGHGVQRVKGEVRTSSDAAGGCVSASVVWSDASGRPMMDDERSYTFYVQSPQCRYVDLELTFRASYGEVVFGPSKEAGPLGIRVCDEMRGDRGGKIVNSYGARAEAECWGRLAQWVDYSGSCGGSPLGIAAFDDEYNERFPTAWHVRDYGLFAANNLYFRGGLTIPAGRTLTYRWRLVFHEGEAGIANRYIVYAGGRHRLK
jgi:hypothetical protein